MRFVITVAVAAVAAGVVLSAVEAKEQNALPTAQTKQANSPYQRLFVPSEPLVSAANRSRETQPVDQSRSTVVCGMRIIPADPTIDSGIGRQPPDPDRHTLRVLKPSICAK